MSFYEVKPKILTWDTRHFGFRVARYGPRRPSEVASGVAWARRNRVKMLMARCHTNDTQVLHALESMGFLEMDTFVRFSIDVPAAPHATLPAKGAVRRVRESDVDELAIVAAHAFRRFGGHFHRDPRLSRKACNTLYVEWTINSCRSRRLADAVLVEENAGRLRGYITLKRLSKAEAEGVLFAVDPKAQGHGVGRSLIMGALRWCQDNGVERLQMETHIDNFPAQAVYSDLGFAAYAAGHTLHLWLPEPRSATEVQK